MKLVSLENLTKYNELLSQKTVRSVNSVKPDSNGNVTLDVITTPGNIIKWETDFFDIAPNKLLSFDLTGTVFENEERSDINYKLVAKVKNGNADLKPGDILFIDYKDWNGAMAHYEMGSYSYIRDKKLYIKFGNMPDFLYTYANGSTENTILKTDVQCKIILTKVISGSNGELGKTPNSITNIVGVTDNRNLGEIFYSVLPLESSQVHLLDGSVLSDVSELYDYLESIREMHSDLFTTDSEFNNEVQSSGKCNKFVLNSDKSVRIPKGDENNYIVIRSFDKKFEFNQPFSLLEPKWSDVPLNNLSWLLSNGQINSSENYPSVYELLLNEYNSGELKTETISGTVIQYKQLGNSRKIVTDKTAYNSILSKTGTAWYYLLDLEAKTFILPQTNGYMKYGNSNEFIKQSLPNIKGQFAWCKSSGDDATTPPFYKIFTSTYGAPAATSNPGKFIRYGFDASTYSDVYQDNANVRPNSVQGYLYFYVGEVIGTPNTVDLTNLGSFKDFVDTEVGNLKNSLLNLKSDISSYAFPGPKYEDLTIPSSGSTLVAPENGWFMYQSFGSGSTNNYMYMENTSNLLQSAMTRDAAGKGVYVSLPVKKGETVYFEWIDSATTRKLRFIYASDKV